MGSKSHMARVTMIGSWFSRQQIQSKLVSDMQQQPDLEALTAAIKRLSAYYSPKDPGFQQIVDTSVAMGEALVDSDSDVELDDAHLALLRSFQSIV